jgi:hypothetical protein
MRFKILKQDKNKHTDLVSAVGWSNGNELYSIADDMHIQKWNVNGEPVRNFTIMFAEFFNAFKLMK